MNKKELYENIMHEVSKNVKEVLNESNIEQMKKDSYLHNGIDGSAKIMTCDTVSQLIQKLQDIQDLFGDIPVMSSLRDENIEFTTIAVSEDEYTRCKAPIVVLVN